MLFSPLKRLVIAALCLLLALPAVAQEEHGEAVIYTIVMNDYNFVVEGQEPGEGLTLEAGQLYRLVFRNDGLVLHEVLFGRSPMMQGGFAGDYTEHLLEDVTVDVYGTMLDQRFEVVARGLLEIELAHGQQLEILFTLSEEHIGAWEMGCFVLLNPNTPADEHGPTHYDIGMFLPLTVVAAG